ncbi:ABC transporter permease [Bacillus songklensis]
MQHIGNMALLLILLLIFVPILISYYQKLGLGKDIFFSSIRGFVQLLLLGVFVSYLFSFKNLFAVFGYILAMIVIASVNSSRRGIERRRSFLVVFISIFTTVSFFIGIWLLFSIVPLKAQYLIPIGGMFIGSAMVASAVVLETMKKESGSLQENELKKNAAKVAMIPTIDSLKTVGLVQIPGTMTGMILAGGDPFESVKYQIFIIFSLMVVSAISSILTCSLNYKWVIKREQSTTARSKEGILT